MAKSAACTAAGRFSRRRSTWRCARRALSLHEALGRQARPLTFVVSLALGDPATLEPLRSRLAAYPTLRFKLDATSSWTPELIAELVATGAVDSVDFKALYHGTVVDVEADPALYQRVVAAFPHAWLEDPDLVTEGTAAALVDAHDRITWDAPIHSIADIESLPFAPRMVNIKPSRIGGLKPLCATYDYCAEHGIGAYGGGQFELGPGRGQAQYLASLFHPDTPNDLAPVGYNEEHPPPGCRRARWHPRRARPGFAGDSALSSIGAMTIDTEDLSGTVALVTGASSGIGEAAALTLAGHGAAVAVAARRKDRLDELVDRIEAAGGRALGTGGRHHRGGPGTGGRAPDGVRARPARHARSTTRA